MSQNRVLEAPETNLVATETPETQSSCSIDGASCPPSHRAARRISSAIIVLLVAAIVALTLWNHFSH